jgi:hypothetical protein
MIEESRLPEERMKRHVWAVVAVLGSALTCGATYLFALHRQLALVEVAASIVLGVQLYLLSSSIGDWMERKTEPSRSRKWIAMGLAAGVVSYFLIAKGFSAGADVSGL